jgi:hypothetical protein
MAHEGTRSLPAPSPASQRRMRSPRTPGTPGSKSRNMDPVLALTLKTTQMTRKIAREQARLFEAEERLDKTHADISAKRLLMKDKLLAAGHRNGLQSVALNKVCNEACSQANIYYPPPLRSISFATNYTSYFIYQKKANNAPILARKERSAHKLKVQLSSIRASNEGLKHQINNRRIERNQIAESVEAIAERRHTQKLGLRKMEKSIQRTQEKKEHIHRTYERLKTKTVEEIEEFQEHFEALQHEGGPLVIDVPKLPAGLGTTSRSPGKSTHGSAKTHGRSNRVMITDRERPDTAPSKEDQEQALENDVNKAYWVVAKTRMDLQRQSDRRNQLYEAFEKIKTETRVNSLEELLQTYVGEEDLNFEMFGAISELNQELEELEAQRSDLQSSFKQLEQASHERGRSIAVKENDTRQDMQRTKKLKLKKEEEFDDNKEHVLKHEEALKKLVQDLTALDEDDDPLVDLLVKNGLTLNNLDTFLAFIEQKINELNTVSPSDKMGLSHDYNIFPDGSKPLSLKPPIPPDSTNAENDPSVDGGDDDTAALAPVNLATLKNETYSAMKNAAITGPQETTADDPEPEPAKPVAPVVKREVALMALGPLF